MPWSPLSSRRSSRVCSRCRWRPGSAASNPNPPVLAKRGCPTRSTPSPCTQGVSVWAIRWGSPRPTCSAESRGLTAGLGGRAAIWPWWARPPTRMRSWNFPTWPRRPRDSALQVRLSPDGRTVAYPTDSGVTVLNLVEGTTSALEAPTNLQVRSVLDWSGDGSRLAVAADDGAGAGLVVATVTFADQPAMDHAGDRPCVGRVAARGGALPRWWSDRLRAGRCRSGGASRCGCRTCRPDRADPGRNPIGLVTGRRGDRCHLEGPRHSR